MSGVLSQSSVPSTFTRYPRVAELSGIVAQVGVESDWAVQADVIGHSKNGRAIHRLTVGTGTRNAIVIGTPHPNEPTGTLAALRLASLLGRDAELRAELGMRWHIVPCADPDGAVLNENWYRGPFTLLNYAREIYRPPYPEQFEWTFHRPELRNPGLQATPESQAVMDLIDDVHPELIVTMHNGEAGGIYAYVTHNTAAVIEGFRQTQRESGLPADSSLPEDHAPILTPGLFHTPPTASGGPMLSSVDYASKYGALGVIVETPLWLDARCDDVTPTRTSAAQAFADAEQRRDRVRTHYARWLRAVENLISTDSTRWRAVHAGTEALAHPWTPLGPADQPLTVAELISVDRAFQMERLRLAGHLRGALLESMRDAPSHPVVQDIEAALRSWSEEANVGEFCGLDQSIRGHMAMALASARAVS